MEHRLTVFAGPASRSLGAAICALLRTAPARYECRCFPDGESQIEIFESIRGDDVYLVQSTSPPADRHLVELLLLADACRRAGADRLTAVVPYFGYARQDRRIHRRSLGARVAADIIGTGRFDRVMIVDAHTPAIEGFFEAPLDHLTAVPILARALAPSLAERSIIVAPDLGAVKLARAYASALHLPMAFVHKTRLDGEAVEAQGVIGDVRDRRPVIVDDMLSTGATVEAAANALLGAGAQAPAAVVVTHPLLVGSARDVLRRVGPRRLVATDTVTLEAPPAMLEVQSVAALLATAIGRHHRDESLADLRAAT